MTLSKLSSVSLSCIIPKSGTLSILLGCWEGKRDQIQYWASHRRSASFCHNKYSINIPLLVAALISVPHAGILRMSFFRPNPVWRACVKAHHPSLALDGFCLFPYKRSTTSWLLVDFQRHDCLTNHFRCCLQAA